jgi:hypothetical protein
MPLRQICEAYDTAEFCRNVHTCDTWKEAATRACITLGGLARMHLTQRSCIVNLQLLTAMACSCSLCGAAQHA